MIEHLSAICEPFSTTAVVGRETTSSRKDKAAVDDLCASCGRYIDKADHACCLWNNHARRKNMNQYFISGKLMHRPSNHNIKRCELEKWVFLPHSDFERLKSNPYQEHEAITAAKDLMYTAIQKSNYSM